MYVRLTNIQVQRYSNIGPIVIVYKLSLLSFTRLFTCALIGCSDRSVPLHPIRAGPARSTATILLTINKGLCINIGRIEMSATAPDLDAHFPDVLMLANGDVYTLQDAEDIASFTGVQGALVELYLSLPV